MKLAPGRSRTIVEEMFDRVLEKLPKEPTPEVKHRPEYPEGPPPPYSPGDLDSNEEGKPFEDPDDLLWPLDDLFGGWGWDWKFWAWHWEILMKRGGFFYPIMRETDEYGEPLGEGVETGGIDILAFYKSFRFRNDRPFRGRWGIFYLAAGLGIVARDLRYVREGRPRDLFSLAYGLLRSHELYHYRADLYILGLENLTVRSLYVPHLRTLGPWQIHSAEEALANKASWEWAQRPEIDLGDWAHRWLKATPAAYRRFDEPRAELEAELAANVLDLDFRKKARRHDLAGWFGLVPEAYFRPSLCPEYIVRASPALRRRLKKQP